MFEMVYTNFFKVFVAISRNFLENWKITMEILWRNKKYFQKNSWETNTAKNIDYIENVSNKSCTELNLLQKTPWAHISIHL